MTQRGFTDDDARKAELWLFEGDWSTRGASPRLESSDFTPSEKQWKTRDNLIVRTPEEYARDRREQYDRGRQDERNDARAERQRDAQNGTVVLPENVRQELKTIGEVARLEEELTRVRREKGDIERRHTVLLEKHENMTAEYHWFHEEANKITKRLLTDEPFYREQQAEYVKDHPHVKIIRHKTIRKAG